MPLLQDLKRWWDESDELDRQRVYIALAFLVLIIIALYNISKTFDAVGVFFKEGVGIDGEALSNLSEIGRL